jgi:uncharacterized protein YbbK (DUF523 family)
MRIAASACLAGKACRYDGRAKPSAEIARCMAEGEEILLICPECLGGLAIPREPSELTGTGKAVLEGQARAVGRDGEDCTAQFLAGAWAALAQLKDAGVEKVYLKSKSPSCGVGRIYDGTFTGTLTAGNGVAAELFLQNGIEVICIDE